MRARDLLSNSILSLIGISLFLDLLGSAAISQGKATTVTGLKNKNGATLIAVGTDGSSVSEVISGNKQTLQTTASSSRIYLIENGSVSAELVGPTCAKNKKKEVVCNT